MYLPRTFGKYLGQLLITKEYTGGSISLMDSRTWAQYHRLLEQFSCEWRLAETMIPFRLETLRSADGLGKFERLVYIDVSDEDIRSGSVV